MAATDHIICALSPLYEDQVLHRTDETISIRWIEYFFSASTMNVQITILCNCEQIAVLIAVALATMQMIVCGAIAENAKDPKARKTTEMNAWIAFVIAWLFPLYYYLSNVERIPLFVTFIVVFMFILESLFGVVFRYFTPEKEPIYREFAYTTLSLTAKLFLAIITYTSADVRPTI